jgi:hypothetical protein
MAMTKNVHPITKLLSLVLLGAVAAGCEATKSETPTSPNVAGPIAGVGITAPALRAPINGAEVVNTEPLRLVFGNAVTNGVRPLYYHVEIAVDREFNQRTYPTRKFCRSRGSRPRWSWTPDSILKKPTTGASARTIGPTRASFRQSHTSTWSSRS